MKWIVTITLCLTMIFAFAENDNHGKKPAKMKLPKGTYKVDNKVYVKEGFKATVSPDKSTVTVARMNNSGTVSGTFSCNCVQGSGGCTVITLGNTIVCESSGCSNCLMVTKIPSKVKAQ